MWTISILLSNFEVLVYQFQNEEAATGAFDRLATTKFIQMILWEPNADNSMSAMHEFARLTR